MIRAARDRVNREGLDALTMRGLSADLGVEAPSLYSHVRDKNDILDGLAELVYGEIEIPPPSGEHWSERLRIYSVAFRTALLANPNIVPVLAVRPLMSRATLEMMETALGELTVTGLSHRQALFVLETTVAYVIGIVLTELSANPALGGHDPEAIHAARAALPPDRFHHVLRTLEDGAVDRNAEFEFGLHLLTDGIDAVIRRNHA